MIWVLWDRQAEAIIGVKTGDGDADSYRLDTMAALLTQWKKFKKDKHGKHCHEQRKHFYLFVISVYCVLGREALVVLATLSRLMAAKMDETILHVRGLVNDQIAIAVYVS